MPSTVKVTKPTKVKAYTTPKSDVGSYKAPTYSSQYQSQVDKALNNVVNFNYNPLQDASYLSLANLYNEKGNRAARDTIGDAAALNGGYATSYGTSAAQQARNQYNQELMSYIPELEDRAYSRATGSLQALRDAENANYSKYRDTVDDTRYAYETKYNQYRDRVADSQYAYEQKYQRYADALAQYQWGKGYNLDIANYNLDVSNSKKGSSGGGGSRSSGGSGSSTTTTNNPTKKVVSPTITRDQEKGKQLTAKLKAASGDTAAYIQNKKMAAKMKKTS